MPVRDILDYCESHLDWLLDTIEALARLGSPTIFSAALGIPTLTVSEPSATAHTQCTSTWRSTSCRGALRWSPV